MCGRFYLDTMHADRANLIMRYLSIRWSDSESGNSVATVRITRSFLWYAMNELKHTIQEQIDACDARTKWYMWCENDFFFFGYRDGHTSHLPWLNHECKIECLHVCVCVCVCVRARMCLRVILHFVWWTLMFTWVILSGHECSWPCGMSMCLRRLL